MSLADWYLVQFSLGGGVAMLAFWTWVLASGRAPAMGEGRDDFGWHIAAEMVTGALLLAAGIALLVDSDAKTSVILSAIGLGALVYALVESAGHYLARGNRLMVGVVATGWVFAIPALIFRLMVR